MPLNNTAAVTVDSGCLVSLTHCLIPLSLLPTEHRPTSGQTLSPQGYRGHQWLLTVLADQERRLASPLVPLRHHQLQTTGCL